MRHSNGYRKLGRKSGHRRALLRNMATSLVLHESIETTLPKAKELRGIVDKMITLGKRGDLHARRMAASYFFDDEAVVKLFSNLAGRFKDRSGGYTRILRRGERRGDNAQMATIQLVDVEFGGEKKAEASEKKKAPAKRKTAKKDAAE